MEAIDLLLNYDVSRFHFDFQSPALQATMLPPDQVTPPMSGLGDPIEDDLGLDGTFYSSQASTSIHSQGRLTPLSISDLDGYTECGSTTLECTHPVGSTSNNRKFHQEKRRSQNREAQRRFRARNQQYIDGLNEELIDLRTENRKLQEEYNKKIEEISRLQEKIIDMNRETTATKSNCNCAASIRQAMGALRDVAPPTLCVPRPCCPGSSVNTTKAGDCRTGYGAVIELVPQVTDGPNILMRSFRKMPEAKAGEGSQDTLEAMVNEPMINAGARGQFFLLSPLPIDWNSEGQRRALGLYNSESDS